MKYFDQGSFFRVTCSESDVESFAAQWPGSDLRYGDRASFVFSARNGDLVDFQIAHAFAGIVERDGPDVAALADDAKAYGMAKRAALSPVRVSSCETGPFAVSSI